MGMTGSNLAALFGGLLDTLQRGLDKKHDAQREIAREDRAWRRRVREYDLRDREAQRRWDRGEKAKADERDRARAQGIADKQQGYYDALELITPIEMPTELLPSEEYGEEDPTYSGAKYGFLENYLKELPKRREKQATAKTLTGSLSRMMGRPVTQQEAEQFGRMSETERKVFLGIRPGTQRKQTDPTLVLKQYGTEITRALKQGGYFEGDRVAAGEQIALNELIIEYRDQGIPFTISAYKDENGEFRFDIQPHGGRGKAQLPPALEEAITPPSAGPGYRDYERSPWGGDTLGYEEGYGKGQRLPPKIKRIKRIN